MNLVLHLLDDLLLLLGLPLGLVVGVFLLQVASATAGPGAGRGDVARDPDAPPPPRARLAVLLPAHDEASGIASTLLALRPQLREGDRMLVVADNCGDDTARIARAVGADVVERFHATDRGKGFALAYGVDSLRADPPEIVVILDADCDIAPGALDALLACVADTGRPAQALYLMLAPADAGLARRLAQFAWRIRNWARPAGWRALGLPCQLMGTGMAFTWEMLSDAPLANASIVEDMKLGIDLALRGQPPIFCPAALVTSQFPDSSSATRTQRTRWEHGHLEMILREAPAMFAGALARRDPRLLGMALDLCVPPLALLAASLLATWFAALVVALAGRGHGPSASLSLATLESGLFILAALLGWMAQGRDLVRFGELLSIPGYILAKFPIYLRFLVRREKKWVRTDRDHKP